MTADRDRLRYLAASSQELLEDLDRTRADVLAPSDLNRALRQILRNQAAILEALASSEPAVRKITLRTIPVEAEAAPLPVPDTDDRPPGGFQPLPHPEEADDKASRRRANS